MGFSMDNRKIRGAAIWNLPTGLSCKSGLQCSSYCYAKKAERMYPNCLPSRIRNMNMSASPFFVGWAILELKSMKGVYIVRLHASGDFYSEEYIRKWYDIMNSVTENRFYAYTKRDDLFTEDILEDKPDNFTLIWSEDGIGKSPDMNKLDEGYDKIAVVGCGCNCLEQLGMGKCVRDCTRCLDNETKVIRFNKH